MMKLVRIVNSTYNEVDRNLHILERAGIVTQRHVGRKRFISLSFKNEKTLITLKILKLLEGSVDLKQFRRTLRHLAKNTKENGS